MPISSLQEAEQVRAEALVAMQALDRQFPGEGAFESIIAQLQHLGQHLPGGVRSIPRADDFNFGFLGMKFVREFDEETSSRLASLAQFIEDQLS